MLVAANLRALAAGPAFPENGALRAEDVIVPAGSVRIGSVWPGWVTAPINRPLGDPDHQRRSGERGRCRDRRHHRGRQGHGRGLALFPLPSTDAGAPASLFDPYRGTRVTLLAVGAGDTKVAKA